MVTTASLAVFRRNVRNLALSDGLTVSATLRQVTGAGAYDPSAGRTIYPETSTELSVFRGVVTEKQATEQIRVGDVWWALNPELLPQPLKASDCVVDADGVSWSIYKIGDPDPTNSLARVYTRRSS